MPLPAGYYDAILMGYALCGNGLAGLVARDVPSCCRAVTIA